EGYRSPSGFYMRGASPSVRKIESRFFSYAGISTKYTRWNREALCIECGQELGQQANHPGSGETDPVEGQTPEAACGQRAGVCGYAMEQWCRDHQIELLFIQKGKPHQNGYVERFNRTYREEVLANYVFESLQQS